MRIYFFSHASMTRKHAEGVSDILSRYMYLSQEIVQLKKVINRSTREHDRSAN